MPNDSNPAATVETMAPKARSLNRRRRDRSKTLSTQALEAAQRTTNQTVRRATMAMFMSMLILLVFNSSGLRSYARDLPESFLADRLVLTADWWHNAMRRLGTTQPKALVRSLVKRLRGA